jgi:phosphate transport system substrate-binding protein
MAFLRTHRFAVVCSLLLAVAWGCGRHADHGQQGDKQHDKQANKKVIRVDGSDTMVNLAAAWSERYRRHCPNISVQVTGGGSGVGIVNLINGTCDLTNTSRKMKPSEIKKAKAARGADPQEIIVGYDALAIYAHKDNPIDSISIEELAEIYGRDGKLAKWSQLGVKEGKLADQDITRVSRQSSSGTYAYFREVILGPRRDYRLGSIDQSGSKDVVALVSRTPTAIGYSGMGYTTPEVKMLKVSRHRGEPGVAPTVKSASDGSYPITRPLQIYVIGKPTGNVKDYLDWILSPAGQKVVLETGYVPLSLHE